MPLNHRFVDFSYFQISSFFVSPINNFLGQALVEFFGTLSREWALECMKDLLLVNLRGNLQIVVQVFLFSFLCPPPPLDQPTGISFLVGSNYCEILGASAGCERIF